MSDRLVIRLTDDDGGWVYNFSISLDDAWTLLSLDGLRRETIVELPSINGQARLGSGKLWLLYRNSKNDVGHVVTDYAVAYEQLERLVEEHRQAGSDDREIC